MEEAFLSVSLWIVHGREYGFGAHDFPASGVFEVEPKKCPGFIYRCSVTLGHVNMHPSEVRTFIESIANEYHGDTYHLISKNCNHFTDDVSHRLNGKRIPGWVNRLARLGKTTIIYISFLLHLSYFLLKRVLWWIISFRIWYLTNSNNMDKAILIIFVFESLWTLCYILFVAHSLYSCRLQGEFVIETQWYSKCSLLVKI